MTEPPQPPIDYAAEDRRADSTGNFIFWLVASLLFLAASVGSLLAYVWWLHLPPTPSPHWWPFK